MFDHNELYWDKLEWNCQREAMEADAWEDEEDDEEYEEE